MLAYFFAYPYVRKTEQLMRFIENGTVEIDNNLVENRIRPIVV